MNAIPTNPTQTTATAVGTPGEEATPRFKVGDVVTYTNDYGVRWPGKVITEIEHRDGEACPRYFYAPTDTPWCSVPESSLTLEGQDPDRRAVRRAAKRLNEHHLKTCAGFYPSAGCSRAFGARVRAGRLEITPDFETWQAVDLAVVTFRDHNGRPIFL